MGSIDDELVEHVAISIYEEYRRRALKYGWTVVGTVDWIVLMESSRNDYRQTARAAIETYRIMIGATK